MRCVSICGCVCTFCVKLWSPLPARWAGYFIKFGTCQFARTHKHIHIRYHAHVYVYIMCITVSCGKNQAQNSHIEVSLLKLKRTDNLFTIDRNAFLVTWFGNVANILLTNMHIICSITPTRISTTFHPNEKCSHVRMVGFGQRWEEVSGSFAKLKKLHAF